MTWHNVAQADSLEPGETSCMTIAGETITLYRINDDFYATQDRCTHGRASLAEGYMDGDCIECPLHEGRFHIPSGKAVSGPVRLPLRTFPVKVTAGMVSIDYPESGEPDSAH